MEQIALRPMTREMCQALYRDWQNDPAIYADPGKCPRYQYDPAWVDRYYDAKQEPSRVFLAVTRGDKVIGEVHLKRIDREKSQCTLGIHLQNNAVKGRGYGTQAERLAVRYAFDVLGLRTVLADALIGNTRSQHVLEKAGFRFVEEREGFRYYRIDR
ncbi:MAG: GNAT family N-acetyltransferase [Clostridia bacterium]|nr:GNAT family N-acetyltransferase [Clostridia bacterium]